MSLSIVKSGFLALLQDYGRYGYQHMGVTQGGPLDEHAFLWANRLLGNHYNAPQIEISYGAFSATFLEPTMIALCGADLSITLNQQVIKPWQTYAVSVGDRLSFKAPVSGLRSYLAVKGGFSVEPHLSSCSTTVREKLGGIDQLGSPLLEGDLVAYTPHRHCLTKRLPPAFIAHYPKVINLRFMPNVSQVSAGDDAIKTLTQYTYQVTPTIDRMGYRLSGEAINTLSSGIISQGISLGAIQIPKNGQPIVLMCDRQTMGGYPLLGCVTSTDLSKLAQSAPGTTIRFSPVSVEEAEAEWLLRKRFFGVQ
ncbi:5-oxoprolinase subunit C family protein [Eionea flava]